MRHKIHTWLSAPDPYSNHNDAWDRRQATTGTWFTEGECFLDWKGTPNSFLWLYGIRKSPLENAIMIVGLMIGTAGCGKTILR
jgi:hypothetical protein